MAFAYAARVNAELVPVPRSSLDSSGAFAPAVRTARVGFGLAGLVARGAFAAVTGRLPSENRPPNGPALVAGATVGLAMEAERRAVDAAEAMVTAGALAVRSVAELPVVRGPARRFEAWLVRWDAHARVEQRTNRVDADDALRRVVQIVTDRLLDYVDFAHVVEQIPMEDIVDKIDVDAVIERLDLGSIIQTAMKEIDIGGLIRDSTEGVTAEAADVVRTQTVKTDLFVSRIVDRVLFRKNPRDLTVSATPGETSDSTSTNGDK